MHLLILFLLAANGWRSSFPVERNNLGPHGTNPYFVLEPGHRLHFAHGRTRSTMTVLAETRTIDGVATRVVEDREEEDGRVAEITRDYYAVDRATGDVYYFGEDVDIYRGGKVVSHEGTWLSGVGGAKFGLMMPGRATRGDRFYQEMAPRQKAMDRAEVMGVGEKVSTPAGTFENCVHLKDSSELELRAGDHKWYAPGVGLVRDGKMVLVQVEKVAGR